MDIRILRSEDNRASFQSGDPNLDRFFLKYAGQNQFRHHLGVTYVAAEANRIHGYATISPGQLERDDPPRTLRRSLPAYPLPVLRLPRLAVDVHARGKGVGAALLQFVLVLSLRMATDFGCVGAVVDAKPTAVTFYARFGFVPLSLLEGGIGDRPAPVAMFLSVSEITRALG